MRAVDSVVLFLMQTDTTRAAHSAVRTPFVVDPKSDDLTPLPSVVPNTKIGLSSSSSSSRAPNTKTSEYANHEFSTSARQQLLKEGIEDIQTRENNADTKFTEIESQLVNLFGADDFSSLLQVRTSCR